MELQKIIEFNRIKYRLMGKGRYYLSQSTTNQGRKNPKGLHVSVWEFHNKKEVPKGFHVHHKDSNTFNNDISNLECLSSHDHHRIPSKRDMEKVRANLERIRPLAAKWHRSPEGKKWHIEKCRKQWKNPRKFECLCKSCGKQFSAFNSDSRICSTKCEYELRKIIRRCVVCGKDFKTIRYRKSKSCSFLCAGFLRRKSKASL